jgi:hypothetical protein
MDEIHDRHPLVYPSCGGGDVEALQRPPTRR